MSDFEKRVNLQSNFITLFKNMLSKPLIEVATYFSIPKMWEELYLYIHP